MMGKISRPLRTEELPAYRAFRSVLYLFRTSLSVHHHCENDTHKSCESLWMAVVVKTMVFVDPHHE